MSLKAILFDLDGTLLPLEQDVFVKAYFKGLCEKLAPLGYAPEELLKAVWHGIDGMIANDGKCSNETVFWNSFCEFYGEDSRKDEPIFNEYYRNEFQNVRAVCGVDPKAKETVYMLKDKGVRVILATNPVFPSIATESRIRWAGLEPSDFELYTTFENIGYCKPNIKYYEEILNRQNLNPDECLMVGNDVGDDMVARELGLRVFLLTDNLINKENVDINEFPHGGYDKLVQYIKKII